MKREGGGAEKRHDNGRIDRTLAAELLSFFSVARAIDYIVRCFGVF